MGIKRLADEEVHPSRQQNFSSSSNHFAKKSRPNPSNRAERASNSKAVNPLKSQIRNLSRMLQHSENLPADVRIEKERALASYQADLEEALEAKRSNERISRYHMVRFFERQKATRALKRCKKRLSEASASSPDYAELRAAVHEAEVDLKYTMYYPLAEKYQSLYPRVEGQKSDSISDKEPKLKGERPPLWSVVEQAMAEGRLEALRDRKGQNLAMGSKPKPIQNKVKKENDGLKLTATKDQKSKSEPDAGISSMQDKEDSSDGGFFEE